MSLAPQVPDDGSRRPSPASAPASEEVTHLRAALVEAGLILPIGTPLDPMGTLVTGFERLRERLPQPEVVIGFDCVTRRLQLERTGALASVGDYFALQGVVGGCTFGEQFDAFHVNQTFTALALGG